MKKIRIVSWIILGCSILIFTSYQIVECFQEDHRSPEISCPQTPCQVSIQDKEIKMLEGVTAVDDRSGDLTDAIVVEKISNFTDKDTRVITYAVIDEQGNVGRKERPLKYTDYQPPRFSLEKSLRVPSGKNTNWVKYIHGQSELDGDLTNKVKYKLKDTVNFNTVGKYPVEFSVMDSAGNIQYFPTELEVYDSSEETLEVSLSQYLIYIQQEGEFDPQDYFQNEESDEGSLQIDSEVDTHTPGIYYVDYILRNSGQIGMTKLVVIVTEE